MKEPESSGMGVRRTVRLRGRTWVLRVPVVMGILNVTPDSFSDGGRFPDVQAAVAAALAMIEAGAQWVDIGGESTRPGAAEVGVAEELRRVLPVLEALPKDRVVLSVDSRHWEVQRAALEAGAHVVNDVMGGGERLFDLAHACEAGLVLMHTTGTPEVMQQRTDYKDLLGEVRTYFESREALLRGRPPGALWMDPGIGFGKKPEQNVTLLRRVGELADPRWGLLVGASRKSWIGAVCGGAGPAERLGGSLAAVLWCARNGVEIHRVHDVRETVQALHVSGLFHHE